MFTTAFVPKKHGAGSLQMVRNPTEDAATMRQHHARQMIAGSPAYSPPQTRQASAGNLHAPAQSRQPTAGNVSPPFGNAGTKPLGGLQDMWRGVGSSVGLGGAVSSNGVSSNAISSSPPSVGDQDVDVVQFSTSVYYAEEHEGTCVVNVMRMGSMKGTVSVEYTTQDGSAVSGDKFEETSGTLVMKDGEYMKPIHIKIIDDDLWAPTLEFKVLVFNPIGCLVGDYLRVCRVKIIDDDPFPSSKYREQLQTPAGTESIYGPGLWWEYFKLNWNERGMCWRSILIIIGGQLHNAYLCFTLAANIYMVDTFFSKEEKEPFLLISGSRKKTAILIGCLYIGPILILHLWDTLKIKLDVDGISRTWLQRCLFRKYLNYSDASRMRVKFSDMELAITTDVADVASGFMVVLDASQLIGKLLVLGMFVWHQNRGALILGLIMLAIMIFFASSRVYQGTLAKANGSVETRLGLVVGLVSEACQMYPLIADCAQRPRMNELFHTQVTSLKILQERCLYVENNNHYFPKWLGAIAIGVFISIEANQVFEGKLSVGIFLATISIFGMVSHDFAELYELQMQWANTFDALKGLSTYFNMPTDLAHLKLLEAHRTQLTDEAREELLGHGHLNHQHRSFLTDHIELRISGMSFSYFDHKPILKNVNLSVPQGSMVALVGSHESGKDTFLKLVGHTMFPTEGVVFVPTHLRVLHVSREPALLSYTPWKNLTFGAATPRDYDPKRVLKILEMLNMTPEIVNLVTEEVRELRKTALDNGLCSEADLGTDAELLTLMGDNEDEVERDDSEFDPDDLDVTMAENLLDDKHTCRWQDRLPYSGKAKMHLARALIMNPEVLVLSRPLHHFEDRVADQILHLIKSHIRSKGLCMPHESAHHRRPRTVFFSPESEEQVAEADVVWRIDSERQTVYEVPPSQGMQLTSRRTGTDRTAMGVHNSQHV